MDGFQNRLLCRRRRVGKSIGRPCHENTSEITRPPGVIILEFAQKSLNKLLLLIKAKRIRFKRFHDGIPFIISPNRTITGIISDKESTHRVTEGF